MRANKTVAERMASADRQNETNALMALYAEVKAEPEAWQRLRDKCKWEHMTLLAVLKCWGDPRKWPRCDTDAAKTAAEEGR